MLEIIKTATYKKDFEDIKDFKIRKMIEQRLNRLLEDNFGDCKNLKDGLFELRFITIGIRIYFTRYENIIILLLKVGDKSTQKKDIEKCKKMIKEM